MHLTKDEIKQLNLLKKKKPVERFKMMVQLIDSQFKAMRIGIKYLNPQFTDEEIERCLKERMKKIYLLKL